MKRKDLEKYLASQNCYLHREGAKHSFYVNQASGYTSTIPRHREINNFLVTKICKDLNIPKPPKF